MPRSRFFFVFFIGIFLAAALPAAAKPRLVVEVVQAPVARLGYPAVLRLRLTGLERSLQWISFNVNGKLLPASDADSALAFLPVDTLLRPEHDRLKYKATVRYQMQGGAVRQLSVRGKLEIIAAELKIDLETGNLLFRNCANRFSVRCPALPYHYSPFFKAKEVAVERDPQRKDLVNIAPEGHSVDLRVMQVGQGKSVELGRRTFQVVPPPAPRLAIAGKEIPRLDNKTAIALTDLQELHFSLSPDTLFGRLFPQDARYRLDSVRVYLLRDSASFQGAELVTTCRLDFMYLLNVAVRPQSGQFKYILFQGYGARTDFQGKTRPLAEWCPRKPVAEAVLQPNPAQETCRCMDGPASGCVQVLLRLLR